MSNPESLPLPGQWSGQPPGPPGEPYVQILPSGGFDVISGAPPGILQQATDSGLWYRATLIDTGGAQWHFAPSPSCQDIRNTFASCAALDAAVATCTALDNYGH